MSLTLTPDQQAATDAFMAFYYDPDAPYFVLQGYAGTGKTTVVRHWLDKLDEWGAVGKTINPRFEELSLRLTATTAKACQALSNATGAPVDTIHSTLGIFPRTNYETGQTTLTLSPKAQVLDDTLLFIDEASYIDSTLLEFIFNGVNNSKIVFIGDPAQLPPVKSTKTPVFELDGPGAKLTQVVRQAAGNPIIELASAFRNTVNGQPWQPVTPDQSAICHIDRASFEAAIIADFTGKSAANDAKILAYRNKTVVEYNKALRAQLGGNVQFQPGDLAVCNSYIRNSSQTIKTDQIVQITGMTPSTQFGVAGHKVFLDQGRQAFFLPDSIAERKACIKEATKLKQTARLAQIENTWVDLREAYACTIHKSQGSTYKRAYIDLDDFARCHQPNQLARLMYVAVSRASDQVIMTGDLA